VYSINFEFKARLDAIKCNSRSICRLGGYRFYCSISILSQLFKQFKQLSLPVQALPIQALPVEAHPGSRATQHRHRHR